MKINPVFSLFTLLTAAFIVGFSLSFSFNFPYKIEQLSNIKLENDINLNEEEQNRNFASGNQEGENSKDENLNNLNKISNDKVEETTTTTTIIEQENSILPESDGAELNITTFSIYQRSEDIVNSRTVSNVDMAKGCFVDEFLDDEKIWYSPDDKKNYSINSFNISIQVEFGLNLDPNCLLNMVIGVLNDPRGWATVEDKSFQIVKKEDADLNIVFAKPETVDDLCYPLQTNGIFSCRNEKNVVINIFRWTSGAKDFGNDLSTYRIYLINHEVGHFLGWGHSGCPSEMALAPVMMQQSKSTDGCIPNGWPIYERVKLLYSSP